MLATPARCLTDGAGAPPGINPARMSPVAKGSRLDPAPVSSIRAHRSTVQEGERHALRRGDNECAKNKADGCIRPKWRIHPKDVHLYRRAEDRRVGVSLKPLLDWCDRHFGLATRLPSSVSPPLSCDAKADNACMKHFNITAARWP